MEDSIKDFFSERCGPLEYVKLLRQQGGKSKGVAFITFTHLDSANKAVQFHDKEFEGRILTVRLTLCDQVNQI